MEVLREGVVVVFFYTCGKFPQIKITHLWLGPKKEVGSTFVHVSKSMVMIACSHVVNRNNFQKT